jgi:HSP20 family protein
MANNPWEMMRELSTMQERMMNRIWGSLYDQRHEDVTSRSGWLPPVDIYETDSKELVLTVELPGLKREDIDLTVEQNTLTIKGQRRPDDGVREQQYHRVERSYGSFTRSFTLPATIETSGVRADYRDGVLTITLPVRSDAKPRQIQVEVKD